MSEKITLRTKASCPSPCIFTENLDLQLVTNEAVKETSSAFQKTWKIVPEVVNFN